jgi:hypothetical protein
MQTELLDQITNEAVQKAGDNANVPWIREATACVSLACKLGKPFTTDKVWELLSHTGVKTHDPRALGAVMRAAAKDRLIIHTGRYVQSLRKDCHRRPLAVWEPARMVRRPR